MEMIRFNKANSKRFRFLFVAIISMCALLFTQGCSTFKRKSKKTASITKNLDLHKPLQSILSLKEKNCSAVAVGPRNLLTSGDCILTGVNYKKLEATQFRIKPGEKLLVWYFNRASGSQKTANPERAVASVDVERVLVHPSWLQATQVSKSLDEAGMNGEVYDLALIFTKEDLPVPSVEVEVAAQLLNRMLYVSVSNCESNDPIAKIQRELSPRKVLGSSEKGEIIYLQKTDLPSSKSDNFCAADSGGGAFVENQGKFVLIGINRLTGRIRDHNANVDGVTGLSGAKSWIEENIRQ